MNYKDRTAMAILLIAILIVPVYAVTTGTVSVTFNGSAAVRFNPLIYFANYTVFPYDTFNQTVSSIMTVSVIKSSATIIASSLWINSSLIFTSVTLTLLFGSNKVVFNGLLNQTLTMSLTKGSYILSINLVYAVGAVNDYQKASVLISISGR